MREESLQGPEYPCSIGECKSRLSIGRVGLGDLPRDRALPRKVVNCMNSQSPLVVEVLMPTNTTRYKDIHAG